MWLQDGTSLATAVTAIQITASGEQAVLYKYIKSSSGRIAGYELMMSRSSLKMGWKLHKPEKHYEIVVRPIKAGERFINSYSHVHKVLDDSDSPYPVIVREWEE